MINSKHKLHILSLKLTLLILLILLSGNQNLYSGQKISSSIANRRLPRLIKGHVTNKIARNLPSIKGKQQVIIRLKSGSAVKQAGGTLPVNTALKARIKIEQQNFVRRCLKIAPGMRVIAYTQLVLNAVFAEINIAAIPLIARDPAVLNITKAVNYKTALSETVPFIGASNLQIQGLNGNGIRVAVLDSGVDYTHADLGGPGTLESYEAAFGADINDLRNTTPDDLFPTTKVVGGFDFVGEEWTGNIGTPRLKRDPDPIDFNGHGTHVADIIGGVNGVAPEVSLYAVKVCSSTTPACSCAAIIQGIEFAVDPNGDGDTSDAVDIINMSLGFAYGQAFDESVSTAVENATEIGVLTVAAAGNDEDKPYSVAAPAASPSALAVTQTNVPSAAFNQMEIIEPADIAGLRNAARFTWSGQLSRAISGQVLYGDGTGGALDGCDIDGTGGDNPFATGSLTGQIVMVDRGTCRFDEKIENIEEAGSILGIVGMIAPGEPFAGGGDPIVTIPGFMISQSAADVIRTGNAVVTFDPVNSIPTIMSMVSSSSRGPQNDDNRIKPEIGAPGASVSAEAGTGIRRTAFSGTSGAAPMVSGAAALVMQARQDLSPIEVKALLMNTGERELTNTIQGDLAPITRIGGGEVRVDKAALSGIAAWDLDEPTAGLSFGFVDVTDKATLSKQLLIRNYSPATKQIQITPTFRFQDDIDTDAVQLNVQPIVTVEGNSDEIVQVVMTINALGLRDNQMSSGDVGADPEPLTLNEYDGYLELTNDSGEDHITVPWHVLPRKAANISVKRIRKIFNNRITSVRLNNSGAGVAQLEAYSLLAVSRNRREGAQGAERPLPDIRAVGVRAKPVISGFCSESPSFVWSFAFNTWERQTHLFPVSHAVTLDINQDGNTDFTIRNLPLIALEDGGDGEEVTVVFDESNNEFSALFSTEHATNTGNTVLNVCAEQIGLSAPDMGSTNINAAFFANDFFFGGPGDSIRGITITPFGERFTAFPRDIPGNKPGRFSIIDKFTFPGNTNDLGILLFTNSDRGAGNNRGGATQDTEAIIIMLP